MPVNEDSAENLRAATAAFQELTRISSKTPTHHGYLISFAVGALGLLRRAVESNGTLDRDALLACADAVEGCRWLAQPPRDHIAALLRWSLDNETVRAVLVVAVEACERENVATLNASAYSDIAGAICTVTDALSKKMAAAA